MSQQRQITALRSAQNALRQQIESNVLNHQNSIQSIDQKMLQLESKLDVSALSATALAEHAIQSADLQLQATGNTDLALRLLTLARAPLDNYHTPAILQLKANLDKDITLLQNIPPLRLRERLTALDTLISQVQALPILSPSLSVPVELSPSKTNATTDWTNWRQNWHDSIQRFKSLIVIHKTDAEKDFFLTPEQVLLAKQLCMAELMQTEWALLRKDATQFTQTLLTAKKMLESLPVSSNLLIPLSTTIDALLQDPLPNSGAIHLEALTALPPSTV